MKLTNITFNEENGELNISDIIKVNKDTTIRDFVNSIDNKYVEEMMRKGTNMICILKKIDFKLNDIHINLRNNMLSSITISIYDTKKYRMGKLEY